MTQAMKDKIRIIRNATLTWCRKLLGGSDYRRWGNSRFLSPDWDDRNKQIALLIPPGASVLEFGAGRMTLRHYLPEGCTYTPSDLVDRGHATIVCDLNASYLPPFPRQEVVVFSGVLEYLNDVERVIQHLRAVTNCFVISYCCLEQYPGTLTRRHHGWVNDFTAEELEGIFDRAGFRCNHVELWHKHRIYRFALQEEHQGPLFGRI
jgi:hypothetical protein